jgi:hypothetical protein
MMGPSEHDEQEGDEFDCTRLKAGDEEEVGDEFGRPTAFHWECGRADDYQHEDRVVRGCTRDLRPIRPRRVSCSVVPCSSQSRPVSRKTGRRVVSRRRVM